MFNAAYPGLTLMGPIQTPVDIREVFKYLVGGRMATAVKSTVSLASEVGQLVKLFAQQPIGSMPFATVINAVVRLPISKLYLLLFLQYAY